MDLLKWALVAIVPFALGLLYVKFLVSHPLKMCRYLFASTTALFGTIAILATSFPSAQLWPGIALSLAAALVGYAVMARSVLSREDPRSVPDLVRRKDDPGLGHTAVIYFAHGEPETYDPIGWINQFKEFDEQGIAFVPFLARPFFLYQLRKSYLRVGRSGHRAMHRQMLRCLERAYRQEGDDSTRFYLCFLDDNPRPDAAAIQALNEGASRIVVSEVFLTISNHTAEGKELIEALHVEDYVPIVYTGPLYDSATLQSMFVHRAGEHLDGTDRAKVGILLVGHGQPDEWDREWPSETEQELSFRRAVLRQFEAEGYHPENLSLAWMEFKEPKPAVKIAEFTQNGVEKVMYFSAAISADAIHSQYDVPKLVHETPVPAETSLINLGAWNDDPLVIQAIKEKIDRQLAGHAAAE
jgi:sirohydrochlorin ferrochelatase